MNKSKFKTAPIEIDGIRYYTLKSAIANSNAGQKAIAKAIASGANEIVITIKETVRFRHRKDLMEGPNDENS